MLYPIKFKPILKTHIWGGHAFVEAGKKPAGKVSAQDTIGESWEISGVEGSVSVVANGFLKSNNLAELIEVYMGDLVGDEVYEKYGLEFPVLMKFIDARDVLSVQVHPGDELAEARHGSRGKTEMWYVVECDPGAYLYLGFRRETTREEYLQAVAEGRVAELLERYEVHRGDAYFVPAGAVHALGPGMVIAEIQETSDLTYRIDDWGRVGVDGKPRALHTAEALDAIDFSDRGEYRRTPVVRPGAVTGIVATPWFTTNLVSVAGEMNRDYSSQDSFVAYMCVAGEVTVAGEKLRKLDSLLIPAEIDEVIIAGEGTLLEVYIEKA